MIADNRVIAVEEHFATRAFLEAAHDLDTLPGDETEVELMRTVENAPPMRSALLDLDARLINNLRKCAVGGVHLWSFSGDADCLRL